MKISASFSIKTFVFIIVKAAILFGLNFLVFPNGLSGPNLILQIFVYLAINFVLIISVIDLKKRKLHGALFIIAIDILLSLFVVLFLLFIYIVVGQREVVLFSFLQVIICVVFPLFSIGDFLYLKSVAVKNEK